MKYCKVIGHQLAQIDSYRRAVPEIYHACHAEKQLMAYFLWIHTTVDRNFEDRSGSEDKETWGNWEEMHNLHITRPDVASMKKDIYVTREPCSDCLQFRERLFDVEGIRFNIILSEPNAAQIGS